MLFKNVLVAATALFGYAAASPIALIETEKSVEPRQVANIKAALQNTQAETVKLSDLFSAATGQNQAEVTAIRSQAAVVLASVDTATGVVNNSPSLTLVQALGFASTIQSLQKTVDSTLDVVVSKKPQVDALGLTSEVHQNLVDFKAAINRFATAFLAKVPTAAQSTAQGYINDFNASFDAAIAKYA